MAEANPQLVLKLLGVLELQSQLVQPVEPTASRFVNRLGHADFVNDITKSKTLKGVGELLQLFSAQFVTLVEE